MTADPSIFKAYDIRGIYPTQIDAEGAYAIGRAFATLILQAVKDKKPKVAVGQDMRLSSPLLSEKLIEGICDSGVDVEVLGLVSTPTFYFAVAFYGHDGGVQVSASHNPKEWNGFKLVRDHGIPMSKDSGILEMRDIIQNTTYAPLVANEMRGQITTRDGVVESQLNVQTYSAEAQAAIKPLKIAIDTANGMGAPEMKALFATLPCSIIWMNDVLDGTFPAHPADPLVAENNTALSETIVREQCDLGIASDGDGDRYFFFDNTGTPIGQEIVRGILAQIVLKQNPGSLVAYDIRPGQITKDLIDEVGGRSLVVPVGHSLIKEKMLQEDAVFGGESSGHFFYKLPYGTFEAPLVVVQQFLRYVSSHEIPLSEVIAPFKRYFNSGEINTHLNTREEGIEKVEALKALYHDGEQNTIDGLYVSYPDYWFSIRLSNTEPLVRFIVEARTREIMEAKREEILAHINSK